VRTLSNQPKGRFSARVNDQDYLNLVIWPGKTDPQAEVIVVQLRRRAEDNWETIARLAIYRSSDGRYIELPNRP